MTSQASQNLEADSSKRLTPSSMKSHRVQCPCCLATFDLAKATKPRSVEQMRRFWSVMKAAWAHWPEASENQFATMNDLRHWLTMKAGPEWREEVARIPIAGMKIEQAKMIAEAAIKAAGGNAWPIAHKGSLVIFKPKSIAFLRMSHHEFCALNNAVEDVIKDVMHITADELLKQHEAAA